MNLPLDQTTLELKLAHLPIPQVRWLPTTGSTNDDALAWAEAGAPDGTLVAADQQTSGRGRLNRQWITWQGSALAFSLVLRPQTLNPTLIPQHALLGGLAVCLALEDLGAAGRAEIKWPNDVLLDGLKVSGVLAEAVWQGQDLSAVVVGIGVNVSPGSVPPPEIVRFPASSVAEVLRLPVDRLTLLNDILKHLFVWRERLVTQEFLTAWKTRLAYRGNRVQVDQPDGNRLNGVLEGVSPHGALLLRTTNEELIEVMAGDISLRRIA